MRKLLATTCLLFLSLSCDKSTDATSADSATSSAPVSAAKLYDEDLKEEPCTLLTAKMVAAVAGVPADQVEQREISRMCLYSWEGGNTGIAFIEVYETAEKAIARFERSHQSMTGAQVQAAMSEIGKAAEEKLAEDAKAGEDVPSPDHVAPVVGAMAASMGGGITFEAIEGLGDRAAFETTRHETKIEILDRTIVSYANKIDVLTGNLGFDISYSLDTNGGEAKILRDECIAVARAVLDGLPK